MNKLTRTELIDRILGAELDMFQSVPTEGQNRCREYPDQFKLHRTAQFSIFSIATLQSYLNDLDYAQGQNINLMTIKYARMQELIPVYNDSPLIEEVAAIMVQWQLEMESKYPQLMQGARPVTTDGDSPAQTSFETYLKGELETYSPDTLTHLLRDLETLRDSGRNGSEEVYRALVQSINPKDK